MKYIFLLFAANIFAQKGFEITSHGKTTIPFKYINNLILIPVNINGVDLTFLLDSGVKETILFSLDNKEINFNDTAKINFSGLGESIDIQGLSSENNTLNIGENYVDHKHKIYIILDESINFSSHVGIPVNGIIGYQFFKNHQVEINYIKKKLTILRNGDLLARKYRKFKKLPISIENSKPYIIADVEMTRSKVNSKMLLDLGNSDAVWLFPTLIANFEYNRPNIDDYLGRGFSGDIFGKRSRIHRIYLDDYIFEKPLTAMPDEYSIQSLSLIPNRKGSIGNELLRRLTLIFDYPNQNIYFKKNRNFNEPFLFNSSGLDIQHDGMDWEKDLVKMETTKAESARDNSGGYQSEEKLQIKFVLKPKFTVAGCRKESPCYAAGIRKNDKIITINNKRVSDMTLQKLNSYFKDEDGTKVKMQIDRNDVTINVEIILEDPIPYQDEN